MTNRIEELTKKIYDEGIDKANADANTILEKAQAQAKKIISSAEKEKARIIGDAEATAKEISNNTNSELKLAAQKFVSQLKLQITNIITTKQLKEPISEAFSDHGYLKDIIHTLIKNWNPQNPEEFGLKILLSEKDKNSLNQFFENSTANTLNKSVEIQFGQQIGNGFKIGPKNDSYILSFTDNDFENYFKSYLKERTRKFLFEPDK